MDLADQIEALRQQMLDEHERLMDQVAGLDQAIVNADVDLMRALQTISDGQAHRAADIIHTMEVIRSRIARGMPLPPPQSAVDGNFNGYVHHDTNAIAQRFRPPLRAEETTGDDLGLYDHQPFGAQH